MTRGYLIPGDWDGESYNVWLICAPNSPDWTSVLRGAVYDLARGRSWDASTGVVVDAQEIALEMYLGMCAMNCDLLLKILSDISVGIENLGTQSVLEGQTIDDMESSGDISVGPGQQFPTQSAYFDAKCAVANGIFDTLKGEMNWLIDNNVDLLAGVFGGVTSGIIFGLMASGPVGWTVMITTSVVVSIAAFIMSNIVSFSDILAALNDTHEEAVLALYNASDGGSAESNFLAAVDGGSVPLSDTDVGFLALLVTNEMTGQLFSPRDDVAVYESDDPIDCGDAILKLWTFPSDVEGWTWEDQSDSPCTAIAVYDAGAEAIEMQMYVAPVTWVSSRVNNVSPDVAIVVAEGNSVQVDFSGTSDGVIVGILLTAVYDDLSEQSIDTVTALPGTLVLTLENPGTIERVEVRFNRSNSGIPSTYTFTIDMLEVRILG